MNKYTVYSKQKKMKCKLKYSFLFGLSGVKSLLNLFFFLLRNGQHCPTHRQRDKLHPGPLVDGVQLELVVAEDELTQLGHAGQRAIWHRAQLVVLDLQQLQAAGETLREGVQAIARQVKVLQVTHLPEGFAVQPGTCQLVVAEVELGQCVEQHKVVAADLGDQVVEQHQSLGPAGEAPGDSLQQVVVHVEGV